MDSEFVSLKFGMSNWDDLGETDLALYEWCRGWRGSLWIVRLLDCYIKIMYNTDLRSPRSWRDGLAKDHVKYNGGDMVTICAGVYLKCSGWFYTVWWKVLVSDSWSTERSQLRLLNAYRECLIPYLSLTTCSLFYFLWYRDGRLLKKW